MRIAVMQAGGSVLDVPGNRALIDEAAREAAERGADVLVTPELFPCGYAPEAISPLLTDELVGGIDRGAAEIARRHGIWLVYSVPSPAGGGAWHISAVLLDRTGAEALRYDKVHLFEAEEREAFLPGTRAPRAVDLEGMPVGLAVCYDAEFPESVRALAEAGASVALVPTALGAGFAEVPQLLLRARALESQLAIAYANHLGPVAAAGDSTVLLGGGSVIIGPDGTLLAEGRAVLADVADAGLGEGPPQGPVELLIADVTEDDVAAARARVGYLRDRRPDLYASWGRELASREASDRAAGAASDGSSGTAPDAAPGAAPDSVGTASAGSSSGNAPGGA